MEEGLAEGFLELRGEERGLPWVLVTKVGQGLVSVVALDDHADPAGGVAEDLGHLRDGVSCGQQPDGVPAGALHGVLAFPVEGVEVIRVMPQPELQPRAAAVFGQLHALSLEEGPRGSS